MNQQPKTMALMLQETLTATVRLRSGRQQVSDAAAFRAQILESLRAAEQEARPAGYSETSVSLAIFAVVAFLDESALDQQNPVFAGWSGRPLQDELFGGNVAGELFFENLKRLLAANDSQEIADVLEVYQLCLLLGYRGRYGLSSHSDLTGLLTAIEAKIKRIRGASPVIAPEWAPPRDERLPVKVDPWLRPLAYLLAASALLVLLLFAGFTFSLNSEIDQLRQSNTQR